MLPAGMLPPGMLPAGMLPADIFSAGMVPDGIVPDGSLLVRQEQPHPCLSSNRAPHPRLTPGKTG